MAKRFATYAKTHPDLPSQLREAADLVLSLERRLGALLFKDFLALHFSPTRPLAEDGDDHPLVVLVAEQIAKARDDGKTAEDVTPMNSAIYFLLGLYALLITTGESRDRAAMVDDYLTRTLRSMQ